MHWRMFHPPVLGSNLSAADRLNAAAAGATFPQTAPIRPRSGVDASRWLARENILVNLSIAPCCVESTRPLADRYQAYAYAYTTEAKQSPRSGSSVEPVKISVSSVSASDRAWLSIHLTAGLQKLHCPPLGQVHSEHVAESSD